MYQLNLSGLKFGRNQKAQFKKYANMLDTDVQRRCTRKIVHIICGDHKSYRTLNSILKVTKHRTIHSKAQGRGPYEI